MDREAHVCPTCGRSVDTVVGRRKTLGAWVPVWKPGPCHNPACASAPARTVTPMPQQPEAQHAEILHLTERALWDAAREHGSYEISTRGRTLQEVGYIHFSTRAQLPRVAAFLYGEDPDRDDLVVLVVDPALLDAPLRYEAMPPAGEEFPHVYGAVPVSAVVDVEQWKAPR